MTDTDLTALEGTWKPVPGFPGYEASHRGYVRSIDRADALGRRRAGVVLTVRRSNRDRPLIDMVNDAGERKTVTVYTPILLAHAGDPEGREALHQNDDCWDNRWPENLRWGTHPENVADRMRNRPAAPKPVKVCVRCDGPFEGNGRRCHDCVVEIGQQAAQLLAGGADLDRVATDLDYPSVTGLWRLAVRYGGLRLSVGPEPAPPQPWLHRVTTTLRGQFRRGDAT